LASPAADFEARLAALWASLDELPEDEFVARIDALVSELPAGNAVASFERAAAQDSTGHPDLAVRSTGRRSPPGSRASAGAAP
jgi:hypothetical protein